jgi:ATP-dependent RNA helicase RhlE
MGFIHDIRKILALLPRNTHRQSLLFSATFSSDIKDLANRLLNHPELIEVARRNTTADRIKQTIHPVDKRRKREMLSHMIGSRNWQQVLVFTRTKHGANRLAQQLERDGLSAAAIHGNKSQGARTRALSGFKSGEIRILVATDIAARGLDIDQLPHVVNYELPNVPEDYVHRIGRTGRAGHEGEAVSLVCADEHKLLRDIEHLTKSPIPQEIIEGYEPDPNIQVEPIRKQRKTNQVRQSEQKRQDSKQRCANANSKHAEKSASKRGSNEHKAETKAARKHPKPHHQDKVKARKPQSRSRNGQNNEVAALLGG